MKKYDFVRKVAAATGFTIGDTTKVIDATMEAIADVLKAGDSYQIIGLGEFKGELVPTRMSRDPRTGTDIEVAAHLIPKFKFSGTLRQTMKGKQYGKDK